MKPIKLQNPTFYSRLTHTENGYRDGLFPNRLSIAFTFIIIFYTVIFPSCSLIDSKKDCPDITTTTDSLYSAAKQTIPYTGYDSVKFVLLPVGTHHTFYGQGILDEFFKGYLNKDPECPSDIVYCEYESFAFESLTAPNDPIHLLLYNECPYGGSAIKLSFRKRTFDFGPYYLYSANGMDSITIQGNTYNKVFRVRRTGYETDTSSYLLYSVKEGIIKLKISESEYWEKSPN